MRMTRRVAAVLAMMLVLVGCSLQPGPSPTARDDQTRALAELAAALSARELSPVAFDAMPGSQAQQAYAMITAQISDAVRPKVTPGAVRTEGEVTTGTLEWSWPMLGRAEPWTYATTATLRRVDDRWQPAWAPELVHPELSDAQHFSVDRLPAERGTVTGQNDEPLTSKQKVTRVGIEKGVAKKEAEKSARALAKLLKINVDTFVAKVKGAGELQFVEAITFRTNDPDKPYLTDLGKIKGAKIVGDTAVLAPTRTFARPVLGTVGEATAEVIKATRGAVAPGDRVGLGGLQGRYDEQLRGQAGLRVEVVDDAVATPSPDADPSGSPAPTEDPGRVIFEAQPVAGTTVATRLDQGWQRRAEAALAETKSAAAVVLVRPSDASVLALAAGPKNTGEVAANGRFAPGSTFKVITALALLRAGMKPTDKVSCPTTLTVDGRRFKNYPGYPASKNGRITLADALANSCNTAFIGLRDKVSSADLRAAAGSLGMGTDYDVGHPAYFGEVPDEDTKTGRVAAMIGQGQVQASPMAMAAVAASVEAGRTVIPVLVDKYAPTSKAKPLTSGEAGQLRAMMRRTVTNGSATFLRSYEKLGAKTGTAEYGTDDPPRTHAWMIVEGDDLALAVFVADGDSGSATAGPIVRAVLASR